MSDLIINNNVHILAVTETHLDDTINDGQIQPDGFNIMRTDRNRYGEGAALFFQNHICLQRRDDLCVGEAEILWAQIQLPK